MAQSRTFAEDISSLGSTNNKKAAKVKRNNKLYSLDPFVDDNHVLHVGGRLTNSSLNNSCTHPIHSHFASSMCKRERQLDNQGKWGFHHNSQDFQEESITEVKESILYFY